MKKIILTLTLVLVGLVAATNAQAVAIPALIPTTGPYTSLSDGTPTTEFQWDQQPFTYIAFNGNLAEKSKLYMTWEWIYLSPDNTRKFISQRYTIPANQNSYAGIGGWNQNPDWWDANKAAGLWNVHMTWQDWNNNSSTLLSAGGTSSPLAFTVLPAPEPISSVLFLTGGLVFAGRSLKKKLA